MTRLTPLAFGLLLAAQSAHVFAWGLGESSQARDIGQAMTDWNNSTIRNGDDVWKRLREGFQMSEVNPELVQRHQNYFATRSAYFQRVLERSRPYLFHILSEVERRGMPTELALLPVVESSFNPAATSPVGASGLWQFMPATGRDFGLVQNEQLDDRRHVTESTRAALEYLQRLYGQFGDWSLALAAYNWGQGNVAKAIDRAKAQGLEPTYENLRMPNETRNYVPKLLAVRNLMAAPEQHGLNLKPLSNRPFFVAVHPDMDLPLQEAAQLAGVSLDDLQTLNPGYKQGVHAANGRRALLIPAKQQGLFQNSLLAMGIGNQTPAERQPILLAAAPRAATTLAPIPAPAPAASAPRVDASGEWVVVAAAQPAPSISKPEAAPLQVASLTPVSTPVASAATPSSVTSATAARPQAVVNLASTPRVEASGEWVVVAAAQPAPSTSKPEAAPLQVASLTPVSTPVVSAATPSSVTSTTAARPQAVVNLASTTTEPSKALTAAPAANSLLAAAPTPTKPASLSVASSSKPAAAPLQLATSKPASAPLLKVAAKAERPQQHEVAKGDTLFNIAQRYQLDVAELKAWNRLSDSSIQLGQVLKVSDSGASKPAARGGLIKASLRVERQPEPREYVVRKGDTAFSIARKLGVEPDQLQRLNKRNDLVRLQPGQKINIQGL